MKKILLYVMFAASCSFAAEMTAEQIVDKVNELFNQESSKAVMQMTINTSSGQQRTFEYESYSKNSGEKNLMVYTAPARVKGQKMLMLNHADDIWAYFARTKRVRKLASHAKKQKFEGSDFSNEDMGSGDAFIKEYNSTKLPDETKNGTDCYVVELTPKPEFDKTYKRMVMWVDKSNFVPIVIDYYKDDVTRVKKTMTQSDIQNIQGVPTAMTLKMTNQLDKTSTVIKMISVEYNIELDDDLFTERGLRK